MHLVLATVITGLIASATAAAEPGDPARGRQGYRACAACHALDPDRHMTGPSLAGI